MNIINKLYESKKVMPDLQIKKMSNNFYIINIQTISSSKDTNEYILKYLSNKKIIKKNYLNHIPSISFIKIQEKDVYNYLFNGFSILIYKSDIYTFETKQELTRSISEPTSEPTLKGPKDSFNENYNTNIGLVRKRIKDENLHIKELILGNITKTRISILYLNNIVDKKLLTDVINKINNIKTDKLLDTYYIKELIRKENNSLIPTIKSTEKPDTIAKNLTEGKICIISENSNNALIIPTFFIDYFYNDEDNYQKKFYANFVKIIRMSALFITIFAPSIYLSLITYDEQILPTDLFINFSLQRSSVPFPVLIEAFILMFTFELLYEADALSPTSRGTSLSILGALVLGDAAVNAGIVSPIMVIVVAITAICSIFFTYQDFQSFIRFYRYSLMILSSLYGLVGIVFGILFILTKICSIHSFNRPFFISFDNYKTNKQLIKNGLMIQNTNKK
jgi:spore germination protein KA